MKISWIAQLSTGNSYSKVSAEYFKLIKQYSNWQLLPIDISNNVSISKIIEQLNQFDPDYVIVLHNDNDLRQINYCFQSNQVKIRGKLVFYCPCDFANPKAGFFQFKIDLLITMNDWAKSNLERLSLPFPVKTLEHLVTSFCQLDSITRQESRRQFYMSKQFSFIVGLVNANNCRKRLDLSIQAFRLFHQTIPNSLLVIKTTVAEQKGVSNIFLNLKQLTADLPVIIFDQFLEHDQLNRLYNTFDLVINTTDGEGFGLIPFECCLAGTLSIIPRNSSFLTLIPTTPTKPQYLVDCLEQVPYQYSRNTSNFLAFRNGQENLSFLAGELIDYSNSSIDWIPSQIDVWPNSRTIYLTRKPQIINVHHSNPDWFNSMENVIKSIVDSNLPKFLLVITSDLETIRYYLEWNLKKSIMQQICQTSNLKYRLTMTKLLSIQEYAGFDQPMVGIVDPTMVSKRILYYYQNPDIKNQDLAKLQQHVKSHFSELVIFKRMQQIFTDG